MPVLGVSVFMSSCAEIGLQMLERLCSASAETLFRFSFCSIFQVTEFKKLVFASPGEIGGGGGGFLLCLA